MITEKMVHDELNRRLERGHDCTKVYSEEVADALGTTFKLTEPFELIEHVESWQKSFF